jgi:hypothetical protein
VLHHEAFHQYCYYYFGEVDAHRWYDEGHGDYFFGAELNSGRLEIGPNLQRTETIRNAVREGKHVPLEKLVRFSHAEYYGSAGYSRSLCYAQGWSLIYFLKEATLKKPRWKEILPTYTMTLLKTRNPQTAVEDAFQGVDTQELEREWVEFVKQGKWR